MPKQSSTRTIVAGPAASLAGLLLADRSLPVAWDRPEDWPDLPMPAPSEHKFVGLYMVPPGGATVAVRPNGASIFVDWGDGSSENISASFTVSHNFDYDDPDLGEATEAGYKIAVVTITPLEGVSTNLGTSLEVHLPQGGLVATSSRASGWLDVAFATTGNTTLALSSNAVTSARYVRRVRSDTPNVVGPAVSCPNCHRLEVFEATFSRASAYSLANLFNGCNSLQSVTMDLQNCNNANSMFRGCTSLLEVELTNTGSVANWGSTFEGCKSLEYVSDLDTSAGTTFTSMFSGCNSLRVAPQLDVRGTTSIANLFLNCSLLAVVPDLIADSSVVTVTGAFYGCRQLRKAPKLDGASPTACNDVFRDCTSLREFPDWDFSAATTITNAFNGCSNLLHAPALNMPNCTSPSGLFSNCTNLIDVGLLTFNAATNDISGLFSGCTSLERIGGLVGTDAATWGTNMFTGCTSLREIPTFPTQSLTIVSNFAQNCPSLKSVGALDFTAVSLAGNVFGAPVVSTTTNIRKFGVLNMGVSFSLVNSELSASELDAIYTNLKTVDSATITVTGNPGTAADDPSIATDKGWTVIG